VRVLHISSDGIGYSLSNKIHPDFTVVGVESSVNLKYTFFSRYYGATMKNLNFPFIAVGLGLFLMLVVLKGKEVNDEGITQLPLLALLAINEIAFILTAIGVYFGIKRIKVEGVKPLNAGMVVSCVILAVAFAVLGFELFPR
jgi:hypothetical protein